MKKYILLISICLSAIHLAAQTNISGVINSYAQVTSIASATCSDSLTVNTTTGFASGDSVLIIQMQGADIDSTNTALFGTINNYDNAGNFEFLKIASINGNTIHFSSSIKRGYTVSGNVQLVTKPVYTSAVVSGVLNALPWNGSVGGVLTFSVTSDLTLNDDIDVSGDGFRGGSASVNYYTNWFYDFCFGSLPGRGGKKGEAIAAYFLNKEYGRGAQASGGGGGNDINNGAAGGGNYGAGGHGGNNLFAPDTLWGLRGRSLLTGINQNKIFPGSGGGGGHQNNSVGTAGSNGGGIILIHANNIIGNNHFIKADGIDVTAVAGIDGAGGGGAGGSILIDAPNFTTNINLEAKGGKGGDQVYQPQCHGNGGGGGGGVLISVNSSFPANVITNVSGGVQGFGQCNNSVNDAAIGEPGGIIFNWHNTENIQLTSSPSVPCFGDHTGSASVVATGNPPYQYIWTLPGGVILTSSSISHLAAGNYTIDVINGGGCIWTQHFSITEPPQINISVTSTNAGCGGGLGSASANASGGVGALSYAWNTIPVQQTQSIINLSPGFYTVTVTDSTGCSNSNTAHITGGTPVTFAIHSTPATCLANDGTVSVTHTGGVGGFSYHWTPANDTTLSALTGLITGVYSVIATDLGTGCTQSLSTIVANAAGISASITSSHNATCQSGEDGSATVVALGGNPPYFYLWPNGDTTATTNHLAPGTVNVMVEDYNGCRAYASVTIGYDFAAPVVELGPDTMPCIGTTYTMDAGSGFSYLWSDNSTNQTLTVSTSGIYSVLITDTNGCQNFDAINVNFVVCFTHHVYSHTSGLNSVVHIYPNPSDNEINITINHIRNSEVILTMTDILGNKIFFSNENSEYDYQKKIDLHNLPSGIYLMKIEYNGEVVTRRVVKE